MRKKFILYVLIPAHHHRVVVYFFIDGWVEAGLETAGESVVGAKVEIDHLKLTLFPLGVTFERMQVANPDDPWKNIFETRHVGFTMDAGQLLRGKYIIETMEVKDLILGTKRTTDGSIPGGKAKERGRIRQPFVLRAGGGRAEPERREDPHLRSGHVAQRGQHRQSAEGRGPQDPQAHRHTQGAGRECNGAVAIDAGRCGPDQAAAGAHGFQHTLHQRQPAQGCAHDPLGHPDRGQHAQGDQRDRHHVQHAA